MFTLHVQGLSLCVFDAPNGRLRICCLNSGFDEANLIPVHLQSLVAARGAVSSSTAQPLRTIRGRLSSRFSDNTHVAWDLTEHHVSVADGTGLPGRHVDQLNDHHPPNTVTPDWSPLHWVLKAERYLPGAVLKRDVLQIGQQTAAVVDITGGTCFGGTPETTVSDSKYLWWFGSGEDRAVTDTMLIKFGNVPTVRFQNAAGQPIGDVTFNDGWEAWLINEATDRDIANERQASNGEMARHIRGYFPAFDHLPNENLPVRLTQWQFDPNEVDGTFCIILRTEL